MYKWDEMTPRERDALVAEKVMDWTHCTVEGRNKDIAYGKPSGFDESDPVVSIEDYTTDISAAWEVVDELKSDFIFELRVGSIAESARFTSLETGSEFIAQRKRAPESISLAALKAVGVDIK